MTVDAAALAAVGTQLDAVGISSTLTATIFAAIDAAGYEIQPSGGGTPVVIVDSVDIVLKKITGMPGRLFATVTDGSNSYNMIVDQSGSLTGDPGRDNTIALGPTPPV